MDAKFIVLFSCCIVLCAGYGNYGPQQPQCRVNEVLSCVHDCPPEGTCSNRDIQFDCMEPTNKCEKKCICKPGYYKNYLGDCISEKQCDQCSGPNEFFSCGSACDNECKTRDTQNRTNCPIINIVCNPMCYCEDGYARNKRNQCIPVEECPQQPQQPQCRVNEVLSCVHECPPERTCRNRGIQFRCIEPTKKCEKKCICKPGYYKNYLGDCISEKQCDQCSGPNEFFSCGSACDNECKTRDTQNRTNCPIINIVCNPRCYCEDGYARNERNQCIPVEECPQPDLCCGPNEEYVNCKKTCPPEVCLSIVARFKCPGNPKCIPGCDCKAGFLRKKDGSPCVPICDCPEMKNSPDCKKRWPNSNY